MGNVFATTCYSSWRQLSRENAQIPKGSLGGRGGPRELGCFTISLTAEQTVYKAVGQLGRIRGCYRGPRDPGRGLTLKNNVLFSRGGTEAAVAVALTLKLGCVLGRHGENNNLVRFSSELRTGIDRLRGNGHNSFWLG